MLERPPRPYVRFELEDLPRTPKIRIQKTLTKSVYRRIQMLKHWLTLYSPFVSHRRRLVPQRCRLSGAKQTLG
jgi:hypothetical protein